MTFRAMVRSVNVEGRTVDMIMSTGAKVLREGWDGPFYEELSLEKKHVRMKRLNNGAPLLDSHGTGWGGPTLEDQIGVVESASLEEGKAIVGTVRFARAEDDPKAGQAFRKVADGIIRNVSIGYRTYRIEKVEGGEGTIPVYRATDWEPYEASLVPMGADDGAKVRGEDAQRNTCRVVTQSATRTAAPTPTKPVKKVERKMEDDARSESLAEIDPLNPPAERQAAPPEPNERDEGAAAENERVDGIRRACLAGKMPRSFEDRLIKDRTLTLAKAQDMVFDEMRKRGGDAEGPGNRPSERREIAVGDDPLIHVRAGIEGALLHRIAPDRFKLDDKSRQYAGMSLLDVGRVFLHARGVRTTGLDKSRLVDVLLTRTGLHTTTDFPGLFEDAANKNLRAAYDAAPQTWVPLSKTVNLTDFKPSRQLQVGDAPPLLEVLENGEYTYGTIGEAKEVIQLKTYGRMFGITRQALINDDLNAFGEVPAAFGRKARDIESDLAWAQITTNPTMGDGVALFASAAWPTGHANLTSSGTVISVTSLGIGRALLRNQKGIDNVTPLNLRAAYLVVPAALETIADQFVTQITPALSGSVNPFAAGGRTPLQTVVEPRLDVASATAWYMATDGAPVLYHGILSGQEGPMVTQQEGFDVDGMKFRCRIDVAFKAADPRAIYKNVGA